MKKSLQTENILKVSNTSRQSRNQNLRAAASFQRSAISRQLFTY